MYTSFTFVLMLEVFVFNLLEGLLKGKFRFSFTGFLK